MSSIDDLSKLVKEVLHIEEIENNVNLFDYHNSIKPSAWEKWIG